jgi:hypothetical protein
MVGHLRTFSARLITRWLCCPRALVVRAWVWLYSHTDDLEEKQRCLAAILELDPELEWAQLALQHMRHRQAQMN